MRLFRFLFGNDPASRWERAVFKATLFRRYSAFRRGLSLNAAIFALRDDVTPTKLAVNSDITDVAGVAINTTNGTRIVVTGKKRKTIVVVTNTAAATKVVTVRKATTSAEIPATDYSTIAVPITTGYQICGPFSGQYYQADGCIWLDFVAGHTGVVKAYELP